MKTIAITTQILTQKELAKLKQYIALSHLQVLGTLMKAP